MWSWCSKSNTRPTFITLLVEVDRAVGAQLPQLVLAGDGPDGARTGAHHQRLRLGTAGPVPDARQQFAVGDAGGGEERVLGGDQVAGREHAGQVVPGGERLLPLGLVARGETALDGAAQALDRAGGD